MGQEQRFAADASLLQPLAVRRWGAGGLARGRETGTKLCRGIL